MKNKAIKTVLGYSLGILFLGTILYLLFLYWDTIFSVIVAIYAIVYGLVYVIGIVMLIIVTPSYFFIELVKERNALRKKVQELEDRLGL